MSYLTDVLFVLQVLCTGERQTVVHFVGKEDAGQAGKGAGETVFYEAERGEGSKERGRVSNAGCTTVMPVWLRL